LCGRTTSNLDRVDAIVQDTLSTTPPLPSAVSTLPIPALLEMVVMRCLQKNPQERLQNMGEMVRLLQEEWR